MAAVPPTQLPEPLRLPHGSVRGGIAVVITLTYGYLILAGSAVPQVVVNAVVVVIAFYFGSHAMSTAAPKPREPGQPPPPPKPRLVRVLLLLGFLGLTLWLLRQHGLSLSAIPTELQAVLEVLSGYVAGAVVSWLVHRRAHTTMVRHRLAMFFRDATALAAIGLTLYLCYALVVPQANVFGSRVGDALSLVLTFYFGSRVIGH